MYVTVADEDIMHAVKAIMYDVCAKDNCPNFSETQLQIIDTICDSNLAYYFIPNYCGYPGANCFAFHERSVGYFALDKI